MRISSGLVIPAEQFHWSFARSSGPGGQNVNKVNSKATLRWIPEPDTIPPAVWARFADMAGRYLTQDGHLVIQSQEHRDSIKNVEACRSRLRTMLQSALTPPKRRIKTRPSRASQQRRLDNKRKASDKKRMRRQRNFD
ncbi:MAG TPA: aminoacyl-tRNA hydrolase [Planctomycetaceae bacterium]|nr:aminoacyl-tRNA hydrolase [Planctomycetaceae bacterium]